MNIAAHVPAALRDRVSPSPVHQDVTGDYDIALSVNANSPTFTSLEAAIGAAQTYSNTYDVGGAVFQANDGTFRLGSGLWVDSEDGPGDVHFSKREAASMVFDDPALVAVVAHSVVAQRQH